MAPRILSDVQIQEIIRRHTSARYRRLDTLERYVNRTQYEGRPSWFDDSVPLFSRAPCLRNTTVASAIGDHLGLVFRKAPVITSAPDEDETTIDPTFGLNEEDSKKLDAGIVQVMRHASLLPVFKAALRLAMGTGTAVGIPAVRNGHLAVDVMSAKWCTPKFSPKDNRKVESLEIKYPFLQDKQEAATGKWYKVVMLFRRVIDETKDTTFQPVEAPERPEIEPVWTPDADKTVEHNLGFCPVVWYKFMGQCSPVHQVDGDAIHMRLLGELMQYDFGISQRSRAVIYNADPITWETGVQEGFTPTETVNGSAYRGGSPAPMFENHPDPQECVPDNAANAQWRTPSAGGGTGRRRGPGTVWQYPNPEAKVGLLSLPSDAVQAIQINVGEIRDMLCDALHWRPIDPKEMQSGATLSGRALEILYTAQVNYCNDVRADFTEGALLPIVDMMLRLLVTMKSRKERIYLPGYDVLTALLAKFHDEQKAANESWMTPRLSVKWPAYFTPNEADQKTVSDRTRADLQAGVIKLGTAVVAVAEMYGIENPAQYAEDMEKDAAEKAESLQASQQALAAAAQKPPPSAGAPPKVAARPVRPVTQNGSRKPKPPSAAVPAAPPGKPPQAPGGAQAKVMQ